MSRTLDTTGGLGDQDNLVSWLSMILYTTGELGEQGIGYYGWVGGPGYSGELAEHDTVYYW